MYPRSSRRWASRFCGSGDSGDILVWLGLPHPKQARSAPYIGSEVLLRKKWPTGPSKVDTRWHAYASVGVKSGHQARTFRSAWSRSGTLRTHGMWRILHLLSPLLYKAGVSIRDSPLSLRLEALVRKCGHSLKEARVGAPFFVQILQFYVRGYFLLLNASAPSRGL